jgi:monothiol glutaredoxin
MSAPELRAMMDAGSPPVLVDVRTEHERAIARIEGSQLLTKHTYDALLTLDRSTTIVFQCHHGIRSQAAAEHFVQQGFRQVFNLTGGIDAWSIFVDPTVPRY